MQWLRWVGAWKIYVSFAEYSLFYRALLQKRPIILRSLLSVATKYEISTHAHTHTHTRTHSHSYTHLHTHTHISTQRNSAERCCSAERWSTPNSTMSLLPCYYAKIYVSFAEYSLFYRALLQKRPITMSLLACYYARTHTYVHSHLHTNATTYTCAPTYT